MTTRGLNSRNAILKAATDEFVQHGFTGASVNKIAERANLNKRMLYHYFDSKEGLWLAVLEAAYARLREVEQQLDLTELEPVEAMETLVRYSFLHLLKHPDFVALLNIENLHQAAFLKRSERIREMHLPLVDLVRSVLAAGVEKGVFTRKVEAVELYMMISSLCFFHLSNRFTLSVIFNRKVDSKKALDARCDEAIAAITAYLQS